MPRLRTSFARSAFWPRVVRFWIRLSQVASWRPIARALRRPRRWSVGRTDGAASRGAPPHRPVDATNDQIAESVVIGEPTVKSCRGTHLRQLELSDRAAAIVFAFDHGLVHPNV